MRAKVQEERDAIWCVMALCHDLGYSLEKMGKLNEKVQKVLRFFHISDFRHVGYFLDMEHQYLITQFLELMATDVRIVPGENYSKLEDKVKGRFRGGNAEGAPGKDRREKMVRKFFGSGIGKVRIEEFVKEDAELWSTIRGELDHLDVKYPDDIVDVAKDIEKETLIKCYRDDSTYWRLCKALERKEHGILSAFLLYKTLGIFADTSVLGAAEEWGLEDQEVVENIIRGDILFGIAQHEFAFAHIDQLGSLAEILILCDEVEEFSRLGRQLQTRKYLDTAADASVDLQFAKDGQNRTGVAIEMVFDSKHKTASEFYDFCVSKSERFCTLYSLDQEHGIEENVQYLIKSIRVKVNWSKGKRREVYEFEMRGSANVGRLPRNKNKPCGRGRRPKSCNECKGGRYDLICDEDKLYVRMKCDRRERLKDWLEDTNVEHDKGRQA
jgi:hypothetical protein